MNLSANWFTEPVFDFEYKKYQLLGYLKAKQEELMAQKIYPHLEELESHQKIIHDFLLRKNQLEESFKKELKGINFQHVELEYESKIDKTDLYLLMDILLYSQKKINKCHRDFSLEAEEIKQKIKVELLGLLPSYLAEGFLLVRQESGIFVFNYCVEPMLDINGEKKFKYHYLEKHESTLVVNENSIKRDLVNRYKYQYNHPAFFHVNTSNDLPIYETILPITSRELGKWIP